MKTDITSPDAKPAASMLDQMGGPIGLLHTALPAVVFVIANAAAGLTVAIWTAVGVALAICALRLVRKEPLQPALSGLFGVAIAAFIAHRTGSAKGYFLVGIWTSMLTGGVLLLSVLVRRPLVGIVWNAMNRRPQTWRKNRKALLAYDVATLALTAVFAARFIVQQWLYTQDATGWLAVAKIAMGYPLLALAAIVIVAAVRRADKALREDSPPEPIAHPAR